MSDAHKSKNIEQNFDFTKAIPKAESKKFGKDVMQRIEKISKKQWIITGIGFALFIIAMNIPGAISNYSASVKSAELKSKIDLAEIEKVINNQKIELSKIQAIKKIEELKIEKEREAFAIKKLQEINSSDMKEIINFIRKTQTMENTRLDELVLKIQYVDQENPESGYKVGEAYQEILRHRTYVADYYNNLMNAMLITYNEAQKGKISEIDTTYDEENVIDLIIQWHTNVELSTMPSLAIIDEFIEGWEPEFTDVNGIKSYISKHKK